MFGDETNGLVQRAMDARDAVVSARTEATTKSQARAQAVDDERLAQGVQAQAQKEADDARNAALAAIQRELSIPAEDAAAMFRARQQQTPPAQHRHTAGARGK